VWFPLTLFAASRLFSVPGSFSLGPDVFAAPSPFSAYSLLPPPGVSFQLTLCPHPWLKPVPSFVPVQKSRNSCRPESFSFFRPLFSGLTPGAFFVFIPCLSFDPDVDSCPLPLPTRLVQPLFGPTGPFIGSPRLPLFIPGLNVRTSDRVYPPSPLSMPDFAPHVASHSPLIRRLFPQSWKTVFSIW